MNSQQSTPDFLPFEEKHYKDIRRKNIIRLLLTYLGPLILIIVYFYFQYGNLLEESRDLHLQAIAEHQANTLDLFLEERVVNLNNVINDPKFTLAVSSEFLDGYLERLKTESPAFVDLGYFNPDGIQSAYAGPFPSLEQQNYSSEDWYQVLKSSQKNYIITDIYLGFRNTPHFTIAVSRLIDNQYLVLRATLEPDKIYDYISTLKGSNEVSVAIVNKEGSYQVATSREDAIVSNLVVPPLEPSIGIKKIIDKETNIIFAYSWLRRADWFLLVRQSAEANQSTISLIGWKPFALSSGIILIFIVMIWHRSRKVVDLQKESDMTRVQLEHASKLASVGELAAGIAHEINNPLAIVSEKAGLMLDMMDPELGGSVNSNEFKEELEKIQTAVFRCRDITRKLLSFVRKSEFDLKPNNLNELLDDVVDGILGQEMAVSNIEIAKNYSDNLPELITDGNQLQQVFLNIIKNGIDALEGKPGKITVRTSSSDNNIKIDISDTGVGIVQEQIPKLFMPFYTTKEIGKGTGLGLSVSYSIVKNLGGSISVRSTIGYGSTFTIDLPVLHK